MDINTAQECMEKMKAALRKMLGSDRYNSWFKDMKVYSADDKALILYTKDDFVAMHVTRKYREQLYNISPTYFSVDFEDVKIYSEKQLENYIRKLREIKLNPKYTFETFIVGQSNLLAHAASMAVAEFPGTEYNPLFIYGGAGLGKTHLMTAIANFVLAQNHSVNIEFSNSEKFTNEVVEAIRQKKTAELRNRMRSVDMLFIDDIQFLSNRTATQEEFFNTFNELYAAQKQIVISSDRPPDEIAALEERMRSRFKSGIVVDIGKPDVETRIAILRSKAAVNNIYISDDAVSLIAELIDTNIRELEGALTNASLLAKVEGAEEINARIAERALGDIRRTKGAQRLTPQTIIEAVARKYSLTGEDILSSRRSREVTVPRQLAIYLTREMLSHSTTKIGEEFGRDHSTVMHACKKAEEMLNENREFAQTVTELKRELRESE